MEKRILNNNNGITLVALVITIVILIILATVSINVLLGEGGLINQAKTAKFETEKAAAREQIEVVLLEAQTEKALNNEYNENEFLDKFVEDRLKGVWLEQDEIAYDGFIFALDRSVPKLGNYTGQDEGPRIKEIKVTGKTTNSVSIEVDARNAEGGKYTYSYKKDSEGEYAWVEVATEVEENTCTFENLEENEIYNLKVRIETAEGEMEQTINEMTGEVPKGTITFEEVEWVGDGTAKVVINTSQTGYTMQYIIVKQGESTEGLEQKNWSEIESGSEITGLYLGDTVYARLYDGTNESDYASVTVEDKIVPEVTVNPNGATTSNSISVSVQAQDNESGIKETPTYTYYIKKTSEEEGSYQVPVGATSIASNTYTFTGLTQGTSYDVKVEVNGDKANNVGTGTLANQTTGTVPGGETGVEEGAITFGSTTWGSNNKASVTVDTNTSYTIEYQVGNIEEGSWTKIEKGGTIGNLNYKDTVYARLTDGTNHGDYASVTIEDKIAPVVTVTPNGAATSNSIVVSVVATDGQSGMKDSLTYTYSIKVTGQDDTSYTTPSNASNISENTYTFTGLAQGTNYTVRVQVNGDKAGNVGTGILENQITSTVPGGEGGLVQGNIIASAPTWSNGLASITLSTSTGLIIQYQINSTIEESWQTGTSVTGLRHGDAVFARLTDGTNHGDYASVNVLDGIAPQVATIDLNNTNVTTGTNVTATVTHRDNESGVNIGQSKYIWNTSNAKLGTDASLYTGGTFSSNGQQISTTFSSPATYYLHVLTVDNGGNGTETVSNGVAVKQLVTSISVSPTSVTLEEGQTRQLTATVSPSNANTKTVTWSSNNTTVASVNSSTGLVTAKTEGSATITAIATDGSGVKGSSTVIVEAAEIPENTSYVGYYADVDGNGSVDGVIYADLAIGGSGGWNPGNHSDSDGTYTIPKGSNFKKYEISQKNYTDDFGTKDVIKVTNASGNERFYVMALEDVDSSSHSWYAHASGNMRDYASTTSTSFGKGKQNTINMIAKWNNKGYGAQNNGDNQDMWGISTVQSEINENPAWYVASKEEWSAFGDNLGITSYDYRSKGLSDWYWSSSQRNNTYVWCVNFVNGYTNMRDVYYFGCIRLGTTF